jgi:hypothetical protein
VVVTGLCGFTEDAARGEDGLDCADDQFRRVQRDVAGVVLWLLATDKIRGGRKVGAYDGNDAVGLEKREETAQELDGEQFGWFCASRKDIVDDVIVLLGIAGTLHECRGVFNGRDVVLREVEELQRELMHDRIDLDDSSLDSVIYEGSWGTADSESARVAS